MVEYEQNRGYQGEQASQAKRLRGFGDRPVYEAWQFWAAVVLFLTISIYGGIRSSGEPAHAAEAPEYAFTPPSPESTFDFDFDLEAIEAPERPQAPSLGQIMKHVPDGLIKRVNEKERKLYINDPVWKIISYKRQEHAVRLIGEYLDWVQGNSAGWVDVRSFKNGGRVALLDPRGTLQVR